jgi:prepilin-type processing-associated H-X9-DG protein
LDRKSTGSGGTFPCCTEIPYIINPLFPNLPTIDKVLFNYVGKDQQVFRCPGDHIWAEDVDNQYIFPDDIGKSYYDKVPDGKGTLCSYDYPVGQFTTVTTDTPPRMVGKSRPEVLKRSVRHKDPATGDIVVGKIDVPSSTVQIMYDYEAFHGPRMEPSGSLNFLYLDGHVDDQ